MKKQFGRSMIEMLGVLAIIGVLSIGGIALYRRAVNNHHANTILDDVNRFAFVIIEKGNYPLDAVIPKGDFKESGIYELEGYQDLGSQQFSITVQNVPYGVCDALLEKASAEYKIRVNVAGSGEKGELYDLKHQDICHDNNDIVLYFGDTSDLCYPADVTKGETPCNDCRCDGFCVVDSVTGEDVCCPAGQKAVNGVCTSGVTGQPCTTNANCTAGEFCLVSGGTGTCTDIGNNATRITLSNGQTWVRIGSTMSWDSAENWCTAQKLKPAKRSDLNCTYYDCASNGVCSCSSDIVTALLNRYGGYYHGYWLSEELSHNTMAGYTLIIPSTHVSADVKSYDNYYRPLCVTQ